VFLAIGISLLSKSRLQIGSALLASCSQLSGHIKQHEHSILTALTLAGQTVFLLMALPFRRPIALFLAIFRRQSIYQPKTPNTDRIVFFSRYFGLLNLQF
jgi:hypothetical protein